jgi:hypothetical protein
MKQPFVSKTLFVVVLLITFPNLAHAYVDPGSGHLLLQLLLAFLAGALFYARSIMQWFGLGERTAPNTPAAAKSETPVPTVRMPSASGARAKKTIQKKTRTAKKSGTKKTAVRKRA